MHYSQMGLKQRRAHLNHVINTEAAKVIQRAWRARTARRKTGGRSRRRRHTRRA
jgi:hypothetical protein